MGGVSQHIVTEEESPKKYKEARRRRIEMRRFGTSLDSQGNRNRKESKIDNIDISTDRKRKRSAEMNEPLSSSSSSGGGEVEPISTTMMPSTSRQNPATVHVLPVYGAVAVSGRSREMEDAVSVRPDFCRPVISCRKPVHFFAVYDGHGGSQVATLCKESMHVFLEGELMRETDASVGTASTSSAEVEIQESWKFALEKSFERMDEIALSTCACGGMGSSCGCDSGGLSCEIVGSTAVVALLTLDKIIVANCGDSRAVLSRGGRAIPLSFDHKPDRPDELARIEAAGGRVIYLNGARVQGILAMSRALGDKYLKPVVISKPDISFTNRTSEDECLILASDGLWDVLSNEMACDVARRCLLEGNSSTNAKVLDNIRETQTTEESLNEQSQSRCSIAAALLTRLALGRRSADNISVIVIDLK